MVFGGFHSLRHVFESTDFRVSANNGAVSMFHLEMFLFSVIYCACEETFSHVFVSCLFIKQNNS